MSKQVKSDGGFHRISSLPDSILCHILSFLPIKDAVRTSVLSSRWRYVFASMSTLDFQYCLSTISSRLVENFKSFVDRLLFFPSTATLECFRLYEKRAKEDDYLRLLGWIRSALRRGVKEIDICYRTSPALPTFLFISQSLVTLKLDIDDDMKVPCKVCLPNLKRLHLKNMKFADVDSIYRLISGCLALEDLVMELPDLPKDISRLDIHSLSLKRLTLDFLFMFTIFPLVFNYMFVIDAPNLVYFKYAGPIAEGYCLSKVNSLEEANVEAYRLDIVNLEGRATAGISNLLQELCNVKSLHLTLEQPEMLIRVPPEPVLGFHNLVELELKTHKEYLGWQGTWLIQFLCCAPNLETLHLDLPVPLRGCKPLPEEVPQCLIFHLKEIKITHFEGNEHMFEMISYFLNHASILEALMIGIEGNNEPSIGKKLLGLPRNSKKCRVLVL